MLEPLSLEKLRRPPARDPGPATQLQWIKLADCVVDREYQRDINETSRQRIHNIAENFEWSCFTPLIVSPVAGGKYAIIDGQHRATAALLIGEKSAPAQVVIADRARQAKAFAAINGAVTKMTPFAVFRAARAAKDPHVLKVDDIAKAAGVRILTYPLAANRQSVGDTMAVSAIMTTWKQHGSEPLGLAFSAILASKGEKRGQITPLMIKALAPLFAERPMALETVKKAFAYIDLHEAERVAREESLMGPIADLRVEIKRRLARLAKSA